MVRPSPHQPEVYRAEIISWWKDPSLRWNVVWVTVTALTHIVSGYDASLLGSLQAVPMVSYLHPLYKNRLNKWQFYKAFPQLKTNASLLGVTGALLFLPGLVVPFFAAWLSDKIGRKIPVICSTIGLIIGAVIQTTAKHLGQFMAGRALMGASASLGALAGLALCAELCQYVLSYPPSFS